VGPDNPYAAVVLAGGAARRLGGIPWRPGGAGKPALPVGGRPMLHRVLAAVGDASPRVVVGPPGLALPPGTVRTQERPPGGGPVPAAAAGLAAAGTEVREVALLAADLPLLDPAAVATLRAALSRTGGDGAVFVDGEGRRQWLCGVWRGAALRQALATAPAGGSLRGALGGLTVTEVRSDRDGPPPWFDCDTEADLRVVARWVDGDDG
jgi:molybdenum cofactor guanylyltransferase